MDTEPDPDNHQMVAEPLRWPLMVPVSPDKAPRCIAELQDCREPCHLTAARGFYADLCWTGQGCSETEDPGYYVANGLLVWAIRGQVAPGKCAKRPARFPFLSG